MDYKTVDCPYCNVVYDLSKLEDLTFECCNCESMLEVEFDEDGDAYIQEK